MSPVLLQCDSSAAPVNKWRRIGVTVEEEWRENGGEMLKGTGGNVKCLWEGEKS